MQNPTSSLSLTLSLGAYTAGMCIGGVLQLAVEKYRCLALEGLTINDSDNKKAPLDFLFFDQAPTGTFTDAATPTISAADCAKVIARHSVAAADYLTLGGVAVATQANLNKIIAGLAQVGTLYIVVLLASGASSTTWTGASNLTIRPCLKHVPFITSFTK